MMDHAEATRKLAAEQYVLGELSEAEREQFEEHFFSCTDCAEAVESGMALAANVRAVLAEQRFARPEQVRAKKWWSFWSEWRLLPAAALAGWVVVGVLAGYQLSRPRGGSGVLTIAQAIPVKATRAEQALRFSRKAGTIALTITHEWEEHYGSYQAEIQRAADQKVVSAGHMAEGRGGEEASLVITVRPDSLSAGSYFLVLFGLREGDAERVPVERVSFTLTE